MPQLVNNRVVLSTSEAMELSGLSREHLQRLLRTQRIEGFKPAHDWFVYEDSLRAFLEQPRKPGPKGPRKKSASSHLNNDASTPAVENGNVTGTNEEPRTGDNSGIDRNPMPTHPIES